MISIIIPTHNEEKYIGKSLARFKEACTIPHEIIVCDDLSTDATVSVALRFTDTVITTPIKHPTISANRNTGARHARGDFFVFIDGDSYIEDPDTFFTQALTNFVNPQVVAVTGALDIFPHGKTWGDRIMYPLFNATHYVKNNILGTGESSGKFQMMRRSAFEKVGGFPEDLVTREDAIMFNKLAKIGRTRYDRKLRIYHNGRRAHHYGWPRLLTIWMVETFWVTVFKRSYSKQWTAIR